MRPQLYALVCLVSGGLLAKRVAGYVPPPYAVRVLCAMVGITVLALPVVALVLLLLRLPLAQPRRGRLKTFVLGVGLLVFLASMLSAGDAINDEFWQPWLIASFFLPAIPVFGTLLLSRRIAVWILGVLLAPVVWLGVLSLGPTVIEFLYDWGVPVTW